MGLAPAFLLTIPFHVQKWIPFNKTQNLTTELLSKVCRAVEIEPHLQYLDDEKFKQKTANVQDGACLGIAVNGFWVGCHER